jgi:hypothetical protein
MTDGAASFAIRAFSSGSSGPNGQNVILSVASIGTGRDIEIVRM